MKKISLFVLLLILLFFSQNVFGGCEYQGKIDECVAANKNSGARKITDYVCAESQSSEKIAYQIIFDDKFKTIDKEIENFLKTLQNSIQYYYGPDKKESFIDGINYINELFNPNGSLSKKYNKFCDPGSDNSIISNYLQCISGDTWQKKASVDKAADYFSKSRCQDLVEYKLFIYKKVAYNLLQVNKLDFLKEFRKKQLKSTREKYDEIVGGMYSNLDYIIRINEQWNKATKQCEYIAPDP